MFEAPQRSSDGFHDYFAIITSTRQLTAHLLTLYTNQLTHNLKLNRIFEACKRKAFEVMGKLESMWIAVECACRILGISTATVLCAVGVETLHQGDFSSLGIYLLVSSVGIMMFEMAYFVDALLNMCLPCPPDWQVFALWRKMSHIGGFHKFLYYSIMSVVCFLHPVLVWHAIIPGAMLLVTALFNFILSKKTKTKSFKGPHGTDQGLTSIHVTEREVSNSASAFFHIVPGRRGLGVSLWSREPGLNLEERRDSIQAMLELQKAAAIKQTDKKKQRWRERGLRCLRGGEEPVEREMEEMEQYCQPEPDTTSDTAPMITD